MEPGTCGRCDATAQYNAKFAPEVFIQPGRNVDMGEDFTGEEWDIVTLKERVTLVKDFDRTCAQAVKAFCDFLTTHEFQDSEVLVSKSVVVAVSA
jgi:hypothetical protein